MFKRLSAFFLALPLISALQLNQPTTPVYTSSPLTVNWTVASGDPATFDLYLVNAAFRNTFALKNNVMTSDGTVDITLPVVPVGSGYTLQASPIGNVTAVLSQTGTFDILAALSSTSSSTSSGSSTVYLSSSGTSGSGSSRTSTPPTGTSSSSSSTVVPTGSFNGGNNGALTVTGIGAAVVGILVAGGAFFAF